jgi:hypothetical protein
MEAKGAAGLHRTGTAGLDNIFFLISNSKLMILLYQSFHIKIFLEDVLPGYFVGFSE